MDTVTYAERTPTVEEFRGIRAAVGWDTAEEPYVAAALGATRYAVCADIGMRAVGMGRIIGDGLYFYVQDVVVLPAYQSRGIGTEVVDRLSLWLERNASPECYVALTTEPENAAFYRRFSFRPQTSLVLRRT
ncbi:GNAT family N-acetyltransferase [Streptomyces sp. NBC_01142]|uniref:GNAT family N-acetyltransferase n=1 Tax=Streptomyces sp. NBC_01142 TaxID=2975865 RepID=UPI002254078D|nr:GNAT family N-acetyltransferase [Streptomyces sp. NBC_01142]MCX4822636.1 GNAT family N-acetyltransferase [Streptomyces sp. NBC_01142]